MVERWLPVVGWEDSYSVSTLGLVKRIKASRRAKDTTGRILTPSPGPYGYAQVHLRDWPRSTTKRVHGIVMRAFIGPCPTKHEINHKDGDKMNASLENLEYVTHSQNIVHSYRTLGRSPLVTRGTSNGNSKLNELDVLLIRLAYHAKEMTQSALASRFGVSQAMISRIVRNVNWRHL